MKFSTEIFIAKRLGLRRNLPRSIRAMKVIAITGIALAAGALVVATSIGRGFEKAYKSALMDFNSHLIVMTSEEKIDPKIDFKKLDKEIVGATPFIYREGLSIGGGKINGVVVKGVAPASLREVNRMNIDLGPYKDLFDALNDVQKAQTPVIVGKILFDEMGLEREDSAFKLLVPREGEKGAALKKFDTVRATATFESGMHDFDAQFILMDMNELRRMFNLEKYVETGIEIRLADPQKAGEVKERLEKILGPKFRIVTWYELNSDILSAVRLEKLGSAIIIGIMAVVAALNTVAVLVLIAIHRRREISMFKALGMSLASVRTILIYNGISIGILGAFFGVVIGIVISTLIGNYHLVPLEAEIYLINFLPVDISWMICGVVALFCVFVSFLTSAVVSFKLSAAPLVEGLQIAR